MLRALPNAVATCSRSANGTFEQDQSIGVTLFLCLDHATVRLDISLGWT
jgi:hypothetical protein